MFESVPALQHWLERCLTQLDAVAGTIHLVQDQSLRLVAACNIPPPVLAAVASVPSGKGMAGLALQRCQPVTTCNLQTDTSGDVRPGARAVAAQAAIAQPVLDASQQVRAVLGVAWAAAGDPDPQQQAAVVQQAQQLLTLL